MALSKIYLGNILIMDTPSIAAAIGSEAANAVTFGDLISIINNDKILIANNLVTKNVSASSSETLSSLAAKIYNVPVNDPTPIAQAIGTEIPSNSNITTIANTITADKGTLVGYLNLYGLTGQSVSTTLSTLLAQLGNINATRYFQKTDTMGGIVNYSTYAMDTVTASLTGLLNIIQAENDTISSISTTAMDTLSFYSGAIMTPAMTSNTTDSFPGSDVLTMTSNTTPYGVASASSNNTTAFIAFDGTSTPWTSTGASGQVSYQFPMSTVIRTYAITGLGTTADPNSWTFEGSNNGTDWNVLDTRASITGWSVGVDKYYSTTNSTSYLYYRLNVTANNGGAALSIYEFKMFKGLLGTSFASVIQSGTFDAWKAFNRTMTDANDCWKTDGTLIGKLGYQFPTALVINAYEVASANDATNGINSYPKNWTFEGSNNGTDYTVLDTRTNQSVTTYTNAINSYGISNTTPYIYYRINVTANNGNVSATAIGELRLENR